MRKSSQLVLLRRIQTRGVVQIVDMPVPHLMDGIVGPVHSEIQEQVVEVIKMIPKELAQEQIAELIVRFSAPRFGKRPFRSRRTLFMRARRSHAL